MGILGNPKGLFRLGDSNHNVGSFITKNDLCKILNVAESDLSNLQFRTIDNIECIDEREIQKAWYSNRIQNSPPSKIGNATISFDELIIIYLIKKVFPEAIVEQQIKMGRKSIDLMIKLQGKSIMLEFHGPGHFVPTRFNQFPENPFIRKKEVENYFKCECVIWPYWIQRCEKNVKALFDRNEEGLGVLWSTNAHFGMFVFKKSAEIIEKISMRFNAKRDNSYGYFYGPETEGRNNVEHPIINKILTNKNNMKILLPEGYKDKELWLPKKLLNKSGRNFV